MQKLIFIQLAKKIPNFMETGCSSLRSQEPSMGYSS